MSNEPTKNPDQSEPEDTNATEETQIEDVNTTEQSPMTAEHDETSPSDTTDVKAEKEAVAEAQAADNEKTEAKDGVGEDTAEKAKVDEVEAEDAAADKAKAEEEEAKVAEEKLKADEEEAKAAEAEAVAKAKVEEEAKAAAESEAKAKAEEEAKAAEAEAIAKAQVEEEAKAAAESEAKAKAEEEEEAKTAEAEAVAKAKAEEEAKAAAESEAKAKVEEEAKAAEAEAITKAQVEEEAKAAAESEAKAEEEAKPTEAEAEAKTKDGEGLTDVSIAQATIQSGAPMSTTPVESDAGKPRPIVFAGPSGAGKGTLISSLMKRYPDDQFGFSVSHTTRGPRNGEIDALHYNFTTVDKMKADIDAGKFIEYAEVHGNYYGTSVEAVKSVQTKGQVCILDIDVQGVQNVKKSALNPYYIFIAPPSMEDLEARLRGRGTEKENDIKKRLANAKGEMDYGKEPGNFDKYLVNGDLSTASADLNATIKTWYPHLSAATAEGGNAFVKQCASNCVIS